MAPRTGIQLAYPFSESRLQKWHPPYLVQPKLDGERCRALVTGERVLLLSSSEEIISSVPHINQSLMKFPIGEYDGELYIHGHQQNYTHGIVSRTQNIHPNYEQVQYHIFDLIDHRIQADRLTTVMNLPQYLRTGPIHIVPSYIAHTHQDLLNRYDQFIAEGYEGFIVREISSLYKRKRSTEMMKFKPKQIDEYTIIGINEAKSEEGMPLQMLGAFTCIDNMGTQFNVGAGKLNHEQRRQLWLDFNGGIQILGRLLEIEYQTKSGARGVPLFSRAVRII